MGKEHLKGNGFDGNPGNINTAGRPKGSLNRNTIARQVLAMEVNVPQDLKAYFKDLYPNLPSKLNVEQLATLSVMRRALNDGEYLHYKAIMDSAYGAPKQEIDMTSDGERINPTVTIVTSAIPLAGSEKDVEV